MQEKIQALGAVVAVQNLDCRLDQIKLTIVRQGLVQVVLAADIVHVLGTRVEGHEHRNRVAREEDQHEAEQADREQHQDGLPQSTNEIAAQRPCNINEPLATACSPPVAPPRREAS